MCYPKPGPRCSSSAMKVLQRAYAAERANPTEANKQATRDAMDAWLRTPDGIATLRGYGDKKSLDLADQYERERAEKIAAYKALVAKAKAIVEQEGVQKATGRDGAVKYYKDGKLLVGEDQHDEADIPFEPADEPLDIPSFKNLDPGNGSAKEPEAKTARIEALKKNNVHGEAWEAAGDVVVDADVPEEEWGRNKSYVGGKTFTRHYANPETGAFRTEVFYVSGVNLAPDAAHDEPAWEYEVTVNSYTSEDGKEFLPLGVGETVSSPTQDLEEALSQASAYASQDNAAFISLN